MNTTSIESAMLRQGIARDHLKSGFFPLQSVKFSPPAFKTCQHAAMSILNIKGRKYKKVPFTVTVQGLEIEDECTT